MKTLFRLTILIVMLFTVSSCGGKKLNLVIIGDDFGSNTISQAYQAAVEEELGVKTNLFPWLKSGSVLRTFLEDFRTDAELRGAIENADVILIGISPRWTNAPENIYLNDMCKGEDNQDCLRNALAKAKCDWKEMSDILVELRNGQPVVLHTILWGDWLYPAVYKGQAEPEQITVMYSYYNEFQEFQASTPGLLSALAFPGEAGNLPDEYFMSDGYHLTDAGSTAVADLLRKTGFEPSVLGSPALADVDCASISQ